jgi:flagellar biosynthesis chaperone FliJ
MRHRPDPLEPVRTLRERAVEQAKAELAECHEALAQAEGRREQGRQRLDEHRRRTRQLRMQSATPTAGATADQLQRLHTHLTARDQREGALVAALQQSEQEVRQAADTTERAKAALAEAEAARQALERHQQRRQRALDRKQERQYEDELQDLTSARRERR